MNVGYIYSTSYVLSFVLSTLWVQSLGLHYSVFLMLLNSSLLAVLIFNGINFKSIITSHKVILADFKNWFALSLFLMLTWVFTYLGATINSLILLTVTFLANALAASVHHRNTFKFIINLMIIITIYWINKDSSNYLAALYGVVTGLMSYLYFWKSADFAKRNELNAVGVLSIRFYFLLLFSLIMCAFSIENLVTLTFKDLLILICLAFFNQILPNFFSQSAVQSIGPATFSFFATLIPFFAFIANGIMYDNWSIAMCILTFLASLSLNYDIFSDKYKHLQFKKAS